MHKIRDNASEKQLIGIKFRKIVSRVSRFLSGEEICFAVIHVHMWEYLYVYDQY